MHSPSRRFSFWRRGALLPVLVFLSAVEASALSTGVPLRFTIDPGTIRQREKDQSAVLATVVLKVPSPSFFICQIRSAHPEEVSFANIVFKKGQIRGTAAGIVYWSRVRKDDAVRISAFSVDAPEEKLWFTVTLKLKDDDQDGSESTDASSTGG